MTDSYKNFIRQHLDEAQIMQFNAKLQWENNLTKLYNELLDIDVPEEVCNEIIPLLDKSVIENAQEEADKYFSEGLSKDEVERKLINSDFHIGIVSKVIENHFDEISGFNKVQRQSEHRNSLHYLRSLLFLGFGIIGMFEGKIWGIIPLIIGIVMFIIQFRSND